MKLRNVFALLLFLCGEAAMAAISTGYYRVKSYNDKYLTENTKSHELVCADLPSSTNYAQVWYLAVSGSNVTLKNVLTERYVQKTTGSSWSEQYLTGTSSSDFELAESDGTVTFTDKWNGGLHYDGSLNVVLWSTSEDKSKWTVEAVEMDASAIAAMNAQKLQFQEATSSSLLTFFTTTACTALNDTYKNYTDADLRSAMSSLPSTVQDMAVKVKNNLWATYSGWDKTEKTFRIADYKAYSSHERWTNILGFDHKLGRLSNPTGIWVDNGEIIQVYVGDIPNGENVSLEVAGYGQAAGQVYSLHEGMNSLLMASAGHCFVFYEVDNTTAGASPYTLLSNYADVTVHIEGGTVQGYFDLTKGDDDDDWTYMTSNAALLSEVTVCLKTDKHVMNLNKEWLVTALDGSSITKMLTLWQNIGTWEDELCGRSDAEGGYERYGKFCNNVYSVTSLYSETGTGNPHASNYGTFYYQDYHNRIFNATNLVTVPDNSWCIAHEQGHNRQAPINLVGNTEMSNNVYSNLVIFKEGRYTSRTAGIKMTFDGFANGLSWPERVAKYTTDGNLDYNQEILHLNWQLYLFFHAAGYDTDFFPRLFDALREDPMTRVGGDDRLTPASNDYLKYYVKCCQVSGYDLTEFFAAYGFFFLPPEQASSITDDGVTSNRYVFIKDYTHFNLYVTQQMIDGAKAKVAAMNNLKPCNIVFIEDRVTAPAATYDGAATGEKKKINPDGLPSAFGQVGELGQYTDFGAPCSAYSFNVSARGNVTMEGTGAVGFKLYDASGNIVGFYNTNTFALPSAAYDENGLKAGYVIKAAAGNGTSAAAVYDSNIEVQEFPKTGVWYSFRTPDRDNLYTTSQGAGNIAVGSSVEVPTEAMLWQFVPRTAEKECFDILNHDGSYLSPVPDSESYLSTTADKPTKGWLVEAVSNRYIVYSGTTQLHQSNSGYGYKMLNYGYWYGSYNTSDEGCMFAIEPAAYDVKLNTVGDASYATLYLPFDVKTDAATQAYYITSLAPNSAKLTPVDKGEIAAHTAVVLINSEKALSTTLTVTNGLTQQVSSADNLLKGTLTSMSLDLSSSSPNYSLGVLNEKIGFYKFENGGTTSIILGANKAYLQYPAIAGVKGFTLGFDGTEDGVNQIVNGKSVNGKWFDLNGRRLQGVPTAKGVYVSGGKKVVIK